MKRTELKTLLDGRTGAWLGRKMKYAWPKETINRWINGHAKIPESRVKEIRKLLKR